MYDLTAEIKMHKLEPSDVSLFKEVIKLFEVVFEMEPFQIPGDHYLTQLLTRINFIAYAAVQNEKVVGGLTAYVLEQYYSTKPIAYIYDLAVLKEYQRKGIGRKLIAGINNYCRESGFEEVFVQADKVDDYAIDFYRSTRPAGEQETVLFSYNFTV